MIHDVIVKMVSHSKLGPAQPGEHATGRELGPASIRSSRSCPNTGILPKSMDHLTSDFGDLQHLDLEQLI